MLVIAWIAYIILTATLVLNWLFATPIIMSGLDTFNTTIGESSFFGSTTKNVMNQLHTTFSFSWRWVLILGLIFLLMWVFTFMQRRDEGVYFYT